MRASLTGSELEEKTKHRFQFVGHDVHEAVFVLFFRFRKVKIAAASCLTTATKMHLACMGATRRRVLWHISLDLELAIAISIFSDSDKSE